MDAQNNLPKQQKEVYAVLGFSGSRLWIGIPLDQEHGLESGDNVYSRLYTEFLNGIMALSTTVSSHWEGRLAGRTARWLVEAGIHAEREIPGFSFYNSLGKFSLSREDSLVSKSHRSRKYQDITSSILLPAEHKLYRCNS